jgi:hypothetical protein
LELAFKPPLRKISTLSIRVLIKEYNMDA